MSYCLVCVISLNERVLQFLTNLVLFHFNMMEELRLCPSNVEKEQQKATGLVFSTLLEADRQKNPQISTTRHPQNNNNMEGSNVALNILTRSFWNPKVSPYVQSQGICGRSCAEMLTEVPLQRISRGRLQCRGVEHTERGNANDLLQHRYTDHKEHQYPNSQTNTYGSRWLIQQSLQSALKTIMTAHARRLLRYNRVHYTVNKQILYLDPC